MIKNFFLKQLVKRQFKDASDGQIDKILGVIEQNPDLFNKIGKEIQAATSAGKSQSDATQVVMLKYKEELLRTLK